jgi:hypothetical protein
MTATICAASRATSCARRSRPSSLPDPYDHPDHRAAGPFALLAVSDWSPSARRCSETEAARLSRPLANWPSGWNLLAA